MIIVTGANGELGSQTVHRLLERLPADQIGVSVREPDATTDLAARGVRVRRGDFSQPSGLEEAFEGATQVLIVSMNKLGEEAVAETQGAIDAAYRAGAKRVLYTSQQAASADSLFAPARDHAAVEAHLERSGRPFTSLRNGYYTTSLQFHLGDAAGTGELAAPADGPVTWTVREDLAEAAAAVLVGDRAIDGPTAPLVAGEAVDLAGVARILSELTGRTVRRVVVDDEDWVAAAMGRGLPEFAARLLLGSYQASRRGEFAVADPTLATLLGREPQPLRLALAAGLRS